MAQALLSIPINKRGLESPFLVLALCLILPCSCRCFPNEFWSLRASWLLNEAFTAEKSCNLSRAEYLLNTALSEFPKGVKRNRRYAELEDRLGSVLLHEQRPEEALKYLDDALYIRSKVLSPNAPEVADSLNNVANCMITCGLGKSDFSLYRANVQASAKDRRP
jgi:tetratricopeptide (TPR) repeat protein